MRSTTVKVNRLSRATQMPVYQRILIAAGISLGYMILSYFVIGFRPEQIFISGLFFVLYTASKGTRNFLLTLLPFIVFWVIFDYMKAVPNYKFNSVHIGDLYELEKKYFGITYRGTVHTLNEFWGMNRTVFLDVINGFFYLCWMPVPISFAAYLFYKNRRGAIEFCLTFLLTNFVGFIGYYGYPAAPPWYVHYHGLVFDPATPGNVAGLAGFDNFFGVEIFHGLYSKSSNVFAAMPSLHAAYALVSVYYGFKKNVAAGWKIFLTIVCLGTWFAALYTNHHYVIDVLVGVLCATIGIFLFRSVLLRSKPFNRFLDNYYIQVV
jgi:hypothetical protein